MSDIFGNGKKEKRSNKIFLIGILIAILAIAGVAAILLTRPSMDDQMAAFLNGAYREGSPEFAQMTKDIIISTDDNTIESPTGMGTISMFIKGNIKNRGTRTFTALEVSVSVVDQMKQVLKERKIIVVPVQQKTLPPDSTIPITLTMDGFDKRSDRADIRWKVTAIKAD